MNSTLALADVASFITCHFIKKTAPGLGNRGHDGSAKRSSNGSYEVQRFSPQCVKAAMRLDPVLIDAAKTIGHGMSMRSAQIGNGVLVPALMSDGATAEQAHQYARAITGYFFAKRSKDKNGAKADESVDSLDDDSEAEMDEAPATKGKAKKGATKKAAKVESPSEALTATKTQPLILGRLEVEAITKLVRLAYRENVAPDDLRKGWLASDKPTAMTEILASIRGQSGLDGLLFGRMMVNAEIPSVTACVYASNWITTHPIQTHTDFWTTREEHPIEGQSGASHNGTAEVTHGLFTGNIVIDLKQMAHNLGGTEHLRTVVDALLTTIWAVDPSARRSNTGAGADLREMVVEIGDRSPQAAFGAYTTHPTTSDIEAADLLRTYIRERQRNVPRPSLASKHVLVLSENPTGFFDEVLGAAGL